MTAERAVVVGGGVGGLMTALALGRSGHEVTVIERDPLPGSADADAAFAAERRGAPQVHQTHAFLARLQVILRERFPDVLDALVAAGATTLPMTANLGEPRPGDEDLKVLIMRRTTFEWVLRSAVLAEPGVEIRTGQVVSGFVADTSTDPPTVTGVRLDDGTSLAASMVVVATGRRDNVRGWLAEHDVTVGETVHDSALTYLTRWYRRPSHHPIDDPRLGGDLGFVKYIGVPGDGDTLSVTLAVPAHDGELRRVLSHPDRFDEACRRLPGPDQFFTTPLDPMSEVRPMAGLFNRLRSYLDDGGTPLVAGFHAVGDAHTTTNPLYGRGCTLASIQAVALADAAEAHPHDPVARSVAYEDACRREIHPWYVSSVEMDRMGADPSGRGLVGAPDGPDGDAARGVAAIFAAAATVPVLARALFRVLNLLDTPDQMVSDPEVFAAVAEAVTNPDAYPAPDRGGPSRDELLAALAA